MKSIFSKPVCVNRYGFTSAACVCFLVGTCTVKVRFEEQWVFLFLTIPVNGSLAFFALATAPFATCFSVSAFLKC